MQRLVVIRSGNNSLHRNWTTPNRSWKLAISSFSSSSANDYPEADFFTYFKGGKWDGIYAFFVAYPGLIDQFDSIWLPDDDIDTKPGDVEKMFSLFEEHKLELSQPSLSRDSFFAYPITLKNRLTRARHTNFVEIMVPLLSRDLLKRLLPLFQLTKSGFGIDLFWSRMVSDPERKCAILDEVSVKHTRPVGSMLAKEIEKQGSSSESELTWLSELMGYDLTAVRPVNISAKTRLGFELHGRQLCGLLQFVSHVPWPAHRHKRNFRKYSLGGLWVFGGSLFWHFVRKPDLSKITPELDAKLMKFEPDQAS